MSNPVGRKLFLSIGFLSIAIAVLVAYLTPATEYEISIYSETPITVWIGLGVALVLSLFSAFASAVDSDRETHVISLLLGGLAMVVFAGLPIIRNYHYYGHHDALTHLGWARALSDGAILPVDLTYPGIHTTGTFISTVIAVPISRALLIVTLLLTVLFFVFVPLSVRNILPTRVAITSAVFSAFLLLPITTIATHHYPHAMTQAVMFSALFVYVVTKYLPSSSGRARVSAIGSVFVLFSAAAVVYHPQLVAHLLAVAGGICLVQFLAPRINVPSAVHDHRTLYGQTAILLAVFLLWTADHGFYFGTMEYIGTSALEYLIGSGQAGAAVTAQGASLSEIGVGMGEMFAKLFGVNLLFSVLVLGLFVSVFVLGNRTRYDAVPAMTAYFTAGLAGLGVLFAIYFIASGSEIYFRVFGLMMVLVIVLGSIAIAIAFSGLSRRFSPSRVRPLFTFAFGLLLVVSLLIVFPSPYIYTASPHVSESTMNGYETAFENQDDDVTIVGLRGIANRYDDAVHGNEERMRLHESTSETAFENELTSYYDSDRYLILTSADYQREQHAYHGLRYTEDELRSATTDPGVNRVHSNGEFDLYYIASNAE